MAENRKARDKGLSNSLIPAIEKEEERLHHELGQAGSEVAARIRRAEEAAQKRIEEYRQALPKEMEQIREQKLGKVRDEAESFRQLRAQQTKALQQKIEINMTGAVQMVVDAVVASGDKS